MILIRRTPAAWRNAIHAPSFQPVGTREESFLGSLGLYFLQPMVSKSVVSFGRSFSWPSSVIWDSASSGCWYCLSSPSEADPCSCTSETDSSINERDVYLVSGRHTVWLHRKLEKKEQDQNKSFRLLTHTLRQGTLDDLEPFFGFHNKGGGFKEWFIRIWSRTDVSIYRKHSYQQSNTV